MRIALTIFWIIVAFFILWIFTINVGQIVDVDLFFTKYEQVSLIIVTFSSLFIGFSFGLIFFLFQFAKSKKENFQMRKQIKLLETELSKLNSQSPDTREVETQISDAQVKEENNPEKNNKV